MTPAVLLETRFVRMVISNIKPVNINGIGKPEVIDKKLSDMILVALVELNPKPRARLATIIKIT